MEGYSLKEIIENHLKVMFLGTTGIDASKCRDSIPPGTFHHHPDAKPADSGKFKNNNPGSLTVSADNCGSQGKENGRNDSFYRLGRIYEVKRTGNRRIAELYDYEHIIAGYVDICDSASDANSIITMTCESEVLGIRIFPNSLTLTSTPYDLLREEFSAELIRKIDYKKQTGITITQLGDYSSHLDRIKTQLDECENTGSELEFLLPKLICE